MLQQLRRLKHTLTAFLIKDRQVVSGINGAGVHLQSWSDFKS